MQARMILVGAGWAGQIHAEALWRHSRARLAAIVDADPEKAGAIARRFGGPPCFCSIEQCFESGIDFDGAMVCTPPNTHIAVVRTLLERGKHVLCEKPAGRKSRDIASLIPLAARNGCIAGVNYNQRFSPVVRELRMRLERETPHLVYATMHQHGPVQKTEHAHEYFILTDACCHLIDTLTYLNGEIAEVHAFGSKIDSEIYSDVTVNLKFRNGSVGSMTHTFVGGEFETQHPFQRLEISTDKARYTVENLVDELHVYPHREWYSSRFSPSVFTRRDYEYVMLTAIHAWIDSVIRLTPAPVDLAQAYRVAAVSEACVASLAEGRAVQLQFEF